MLQVYKLTGETGSYRYMAPEVFRHEPYNLKVDVYSFAMIIFQLFETTTPFHGHDPVDAARQAAMLGARPGFPPRRNLTPMTQVRLLCLSNMCYRTLNSLRAGLFTVKKVYACCCCCCWAHPASSGCLLPRDASSLLFNVDQQ
jgi:serine/threonine protein kinase